MEPISLQDALDYCLENPDGLSVQDLLDSFPEHREELAALLGLSAVIASTPPPVPGARRSAIKARVVSAAAQLRPPQEPTNPAPPRPPTPVHANVTAPTPPRRRVSGPVPIEVYTKPRRPLFLRPGFITAVAAALIVAFVWWSSRGALPDSPFYNVRIASENVAINFAGSEADQAGAHLNAATSRLFELREMQQRDRLAEAQEAVVNYEHHLTSAELLWQRTSPRSVPVAELLYVTSVAGRVTFDALGGALSTLPAPYMQDVAEAREAIGRVSAGTEMALVAAGRDPVAVLTGMAAGNSTLAALVSPAFPNLTVPTQPSVPSTSTGTTAGAGTPTAVAVVQDTATTPPTTAPTEPPAPTDTPVVEPPTATPAVPPPPPPSATPPPPATNTPVPAPPTQAPQPPPTSTGTPVIASVCDLSVANVSVACREEAGVNWLALVDNRGSTPVTATWVAVLEVQNQGGGGFTQVASMSGTDVFAPGTTNLNRTMNYAFGPEAEKARVILRIDTSGNACTVPSKQSLDVASCNRQNPGGGNGGGPPDKTKTPPGLENKPTERPKDEPGPPSNPNDEPPGPLPRP